jgi:uncharacterized membrane protein YdjX (TVP38/TMEM64 family)
VYSQEHFILAALLFFLFSILSVLLGPLTSSPLVPIAVAVWGKWLTFFLLMAGWVVGGTISYFIGRSVGYVLLLRFVSREQIESWRTFISRETNFLFALLFRFAMPAETGYVFGLVRYELWKFLLVTILVEIPVAIALIFVGDALIAESFATFAALAILAVGILGGAGYFLRKYLRRHDRTRGNV